MHGQKEDHIYDVEIFLCLEIKLKSWLLRIFNPKSFKGNSKTIYKIRINNLQQSAYSSLTCLIIQSLIYILSSISWSRTACTFSYRPTEHSNEFTLGGKRWVYWLETAWPMAEAHERTQCLKGFQVNRPSNWPFLGRWDHSLFWILSLICANSFSFGQISASQQASEESHAPIDLQSFLPLAAVLFTKPMCFVTDVKSEGLLMLCLSVLID